MARSGHSVWLSGGVGELRIYLGAPPRGTKGKRVEPMRFATELREWIANGVGANHVAWIRIYDSLGRPLPKPPQRSDLARMAEELVDAFERGRLVAIEGTFGKTTARGEATAPSTVRDPAPPAYLADSNDEPERVTTWIGVQLVDEAGVPIPGRRYRIVTSTGQVLEGTLDARGIAMHQGLDAGMCQVSCPYVDARPQTTHEAGRDEHVSGIAHAYGFEDYAAVWNHPENAKLRKSRTRPHVLMAKDQVVVPEAKDRPVPRTTGAQHLFTLVRSPLKLRVRLLHATMKPAEDEACVLLGEKLSTKSDGKIAVEVDKTAREGRLELPDAQLTLSIGGLSPTDDDSDAGWKARLHNLGFLWDPRLEGKDGERELRFALQDFQAECKLPLTGTLDSRTKAKLEEVYGC
jgi:hypothetical protein